MPPTSQRISPGTAYLLSTLTAAFWAGNFVVGRGVVDAIPPLTLAWARWTGAALLILPFVWGRLRTDWPEIRKNVPFLFLLGFMGAGIFNTLQYLALTSMTAVTGAVINSAGPILIAVCCWLILGESLRRGQIVGIVISLAGVLLVVMRGDPTRLPSFGQSAGELIMLSAMLIWGVYTAIMRFRPPIHPLSYAAVLYVVASIVNTPLMLWELGSGTPITLSPSSMAAIAYVAIFPSLLAYLFFNAAVESIGGARTSAFFHLVPVMAAGLAIVFLGELFQPYHAVGFGLILLGVWLTARGK